MLWVRNPNEQVRILVYGTEMQLILSNGVDVRQYNLTFGSLDEVQGYVVECMTHLIIRGFRRTE